MTAFATRRYKRPSDDRVAGTTTLIIESYGFDAAMDFAHIQKDASNPGNYNNRNLTFGSAFWERVIEELHARGRNGGRTL